MKYNLEKVIKNKVEILSQIIYDMTRGDTMRDFSDSIKYYVVRNNLEKNNGRICCEVCGREIKSINEGHFDHIEAYVKGKSTKDNCQILCSSCNLKKNDKELNDFLLDEQARKFLEGVNVNDQNSIEDANVNIQDKTINGEITKESFDLLISKFIESKGNITKIDFSRVYNNLPSFYYVTKYYGDFKTLKKAFNIKEKIIWNRETIKEALEKYINKYGNVFEKDLKVKNNLPSYPCLIKYYPEFSGLNELKLNMFNLKVRTQWSREDAIQAGKTFVNKNGKIRLKDLNSSNNMPNAKVIYRYFGSLENFQKAIGSKVSHRNELITMKEIEKAVNETLNSKKTFETTKDLFKVFPISQSVIYRNFGSIESFYKKYNICILKKKKSKFSKQEIDDIILKYIKDGKKIPSAAKELVSLGMPSRDAIMRYYRDWHEPFVIYSKLYEKMN